MVNAIGCLITITPGNGKITFGQITCGSNLVDTTAILLLSRKYIVCSLEVGNHLLPQFLVSKLSV